MYVPIIIIHCGKHLHSNRYFKCKNSRANLVMMCQPSGWHTCTLHSNGVHQNYNLEKKALTDLFQYCQVKECLNHSCLTFKHIVNLTLDCRTNSIGMVIGFCVSFYNKTTVDPQVPQELLVLSCLI